MICYTIGHSTRTLQNFLDIIEYYRIDCIIDIRGESSLNHRKFERFNRKNMEKILRRNNITYIYSGKELGFEHEKEQLDFDKIVKTHIFKKGICKIIHEINIRKRVALMCLEKEPINCNRSILIGYILSKRGIDVEHIIDEKNVKSQKFIEEELFIKFEPKIKENLIEFSIFDILNNLKYDEVSTKDIKRKIIEKGYRMKFKEII